MAMPGRYTVSLSKIVDGEITELSGAQPFEVVPLRAGALAGVSGEEVHAYRRSVDAFQQDYMATSMELEKSQKRVTALLMAVQRADRESKELETKIFKTEKELQALNIRLNGSPSFKEVIDNTDPTPGYRLGFALTGLFTTYGPTRQHKQVLETGKKELAAIKSDLAVIVDITLPQLEQELKEAGAPWIEGQGLIK
jgi:hypothetical protein